MQLDQDLVLSTNSGTNSGTVTITDAANEAITMVNSKWKALEL